MIVFSTYCWPRCSRSVGYMNDYIHGFYTIQNLSPTPFLLLICTAKPLVSKYMYLKRQNVCPEENILYQRVSLTEELYQGK